MRLLSKGYCASTTENVEEPIDEKVSARIPGIVDTLGIRLVYTGQTRTLRQFLNSLNHFERPYVVRGVEVKPVSETGKQRGRELLGPSPFGFSGDAGRGEDPSAIMIVKENYSEFSVIVEYIEFPARNLSDPANSL